MPRLMNGTLMRSEMSCIAPTLMYKGVKNKLIFLYLKTRHCKYYTLNTMPNFHELYFGGSGYKVQCSLVVLPIIILTLSTLKQNL